MGRSGSWGAGGVRLAPDRVPPAHQPARAIPAPASLAYFQGREAHYPPRPRGTQTAFRGNGPRRATPGHPLGSSSASRRPSAWRAGRGGGAGGRRALTGGRGARASSSGGGGSSSSSRSGSRRAREAAPRSPAARAIRPGAAGPAGLPPAAAPYSLRPAPAPAPPPAFVLHSPRARGQGRGVARPADPVLPGAGRAAVSEARRDGAGRENDPGQEGAAAPGLSVPNAMGRLRGVGFPCSPPPPDRPTWEGASRAGTFSCVPGDTGHGEAAGQDVSLAESASSQRGKLRPREGGAR